MTITRINPVDNLTVSDGSASMSSTYISSGTIYLHRRGRTVFAYGSLKFKGHSGRVDIGTVPAGYRPPATAYIHLNDAAPTLYLLVQSDGVVKMSTSMTANAQYWFSGCWVV